MDKRAAGLLVAFLVLALLLGVLSVSSRGLEIIAAIAAGLAAIGFLYLTVWHTKLAILVVWLYSVFEYVVDGWTSTLGATAESSVHKLSNFLLVPLFVVILLKYRHEHKRLAALTFALAGLGILWGAISSLQMGFGAESVIGIWLGNKVWVVLLLTTRVPWSDSDKERIYQFFMKVGSVVAAIAVIEFFVPSALVTLLHVSIKVDPFRPDAVQSVFANPGVLSQFMSMLFVIPLARWSITRRRWDLAYVLAFGVCTILSFKLRGALALGGGMLAVAFYLRTREAVRVLMFSALAVLAVIALGQAYLRIVDTRVVAFTTGTSARGELYSTGLRIAETDAPFGSGYGTFGSYASLLYYSPLYYEYGLSDQYGFAPSNPIYNTDTSWPSVLAETGFLGLAFFAAALLTVSIRLFSAPPNEQDLDSFVRVAAGSLLVVFLVNSLAGADIFDNLSTLTTFLFVGMALRRRSLGDVAGSVVATSLPSARPPGHGSS